MSSFLENNEKQSLFSIIKTFRVSRTKATLFFQISVAAIKLVRHGKLQSLQSGQVYSRCVNRARKELETTPIDVTWKFQPSTKFKVGKE